MIELTFRSHWSWEFWQVCEAEIKSPCREILQELLSILDLYGNTTSVRSTYPARGEYALQGKTSLLVHSIDVARRCLSSKEGPIVRNLAAVAGLGHDLGKLSLVHRGRYTAIMHAHWGAEYVSRVIDGRLNDQQAEAIVSAIRCHHGAGIGAVHRVLQKADADARGQALNVAFDGTAWPKGGRT